MKNHMSAFNYMYGKNIEELNQKLKPEDKKLLNYWIEKSMYNKIIIYFGFSFGESIKNIFMTKNNKLSYLLSFCIMRENHEGVELLLSKGGNPILDDGQSLKGASETPHI